jgi:histidinol-phosphate aminotransferase
MGCKGGKRMKPWEANLRRVVPYVPGEQPKGSNLIKLNTNENPYPPSPLVQQVQLEMETDDLRKYPDPGALCLVRSLAKYYGLQEDQIFVGVGSDDVLAMAFLTFFNSGKPVLFPDITYSFYKVWADLFHIPYETPALDKDFAIVSGDYQRENGGVVFPNPNAPTGLYMPLEQVEEIIKANQDVIVIVDEAYIDFAGPSARELLDSYENLLVVQTFSKSRSMAGLRIGFAMGHPDLIRALNDVKYSYNSYTMNLPSQCMGVAAVEDKAYFEKRVRQIIDTRERAKLRLKELGFSFPDSQANFLFASHKSVPASALFEALRQQQIYVRYFNAPRLDNSLRITIGTDEEMEELFTFLEAYLHSVNGNGDEADERGK